MNQIINTYKWVIPPLFVVSLILVANLALISAGTASGNIYYVAPNGDDSNPGTLEEPWKTIQHAVDSVNLGDIIHLRSGTYHESVQFHQSGEQGNPITLTNHMDETVTIDGGPNPAIMDIDGTQYWIIEGLTLDSYAEFTLRLEAWGCGGTCRGTHHWIIRNNMIIGAIQIYGSYNLFEANEVDGSQHKGSENGVFEEQEVSHHNIFKDNHIHHFNIRGIWSMDRTHDDIFENNYIHHIGDSNEGMCIDTDGFGNVEWRHTIRGNHLHHCGEAGIALENTFDSVVENNIIHDTGRISINVINYGPGVGPGSKKCEAGGENNQYGDTDGDNDCRGDLTENIIRQNLIYDGGQNGAVMIFYAGGVSILGNTIHYAYSNGIYVNSGIVYCPEIEIRGNIIADSGEASISIEEVASLVQDDHNLLFRKGSAFVYEIRPTVIYYTLSEYQENTGKGQASIQADPRFVDPGGNNFHLQDISPAIDAGVNIGLTTDLDGNPRLRGASYDIGAYESPAAPPHPGDFDGDGDTDIAVYHWHATYGQQWYIKDQGTWSWGNETSIPVPADYDGDGDIDIAVYDNGTWYVKDQGVYYWGDADSIAVPGDYDGDGDADIAAFDLHPTWGQLWYIKDQPTHSWGNADSLPVQADYNGDGTTDVAVYNDGLWYIEGIGVFGWGNAVSIPVPGDYDGDGDADLAVYIVESGKGTWYIQGQPTVLWGGPESIPVPGDYNGDGITDLAVFDNGTWYVTAVLTYTWGGPGDYPLPAPDYDGDGDPY